MYVVAKFRRSDAPRINLLSSIYHLLGVCMAYVYTLASAKVRQIHGRLQSRCLLCQEGIPNLAIDLDQQVTYQVPWVLISTDSMTATAVPAPVGFRSASPCSRVATARFPSSSLFGADYILSYTRNYTELYNV
jgi:hypothetical protein